MSKNGSYNFIEAVDSFEKQYIHAVKRVIAETATLIQTQAQALAPIGNVDGGNLKKSIEISFSDNGLKASIIVGAFYGIYVEWGTGIYAQHPSIPGRKTPWVYYSDELNRFVFTRGMKASPFFNPAYEAGMKYFVKEMEKLKG